MPLSEHEQKILAQLEESLEQEDPQFAERVRSESVYRHAGRHCIWAGLAFIAGLAVLVAFFSQSVLAGLLGVVVMFASALIFERNLRRMGKAGWHDLSQSLRTDQPGGADTANRNPRVWLRSHFRRES